MKGVRGKTGEVRRGLATSGVQLAIARSKAQKAQKGYNWRQAVQRRSVNVGLLPSCLSPFWALPLMNA